MFHFRVADYDILLQDNNITLPLDVKDDEFADWISRMTWIYVTLVLSSVIFLLLANSLFGLLISLSSKNMHDEMFRKVLRAQVAFFDTNPVGKRCVKQK